MKAYEFPTKVTSDGNLKLPDALTRALPHDQSVRVILLVSDSGEDDEAGWARLAAQQFFAGYSEADSVYDRM